jgi:hypothetical protein
MLGCGGKEERGGQRFHSPLLGEHPRPPAAPTTPFPLPLWPDLSDLESAFLHFTFLPVRRERGRESRIGTDRRRT